MDTVYRRYKENPSFSSTLLDEIYRSIDQRDHQQLAKNFQDQRHDCRVKKPVVGRKSAAEVERISILSGGDSRCLNSSSSSSESSGQSTVSTETNFGRMNGCFVDDHDERRDRRVRKPVVGRKSAAELERSSVWLNLNASSSESSCGGGFSSSANESLYGDLFKPKPIRTSNHRDDEFVTRVDRKHESKFVRTKSKALKIYSDLKKVKQPISPGGRLATFLNSIFTTGNTKKPKTSSVSATSTASASGGYAEAARSHLVRKSKSANTSTCSSASSFSRSCLSNTASSRGKLSSGLKRSVRFYPVSVIVGEDCQPCGHKSLYEEERGKHSINKEFQVNSSEKHRHIERAARNLLKNYQKKVECELDSITNDEDENQSDDGKSDSSSDLFELDNLSVVERHGYRDELPVYETTRLATNRAIANGLII